MHIFLHPGVTMQVIFLWLSSHKDAHCKKITFNKKIFQCFTRRNSLYIQSHNWLNTKYLIKSLLWKAILEKLQENLKVEVACNQLSIWVEPVQWGGHRKVKRTMLEDQTFSSPDSPLNLSFQSLSSYGDFAQVICGHAQSGGSLNHPMCIFITDIKNMTLYILVSVLTL